MMWRPCAAENSILLRHASGSHPARQQPTYVLLLLSSTFLLWRVAWLCRLYLLVSGLCFAPRPTRARRRQRHPRVPILVIRRVCAGVRAQQRAHLVGLCGCQSDMLQRDMLLCM
jgi:hypothetical protein